MRTSACGGFFKPHKLGLVVKPRQPATGLDTKSRTAVVGVFIAEQRAARAQYI